MDNIEVRGESTPQIRANINRQIYKVRDFLLDGGRLTCDIATRRLYIGGSALPRRIKDCRDILEMKIHARWKPYLTAENFKTKVREYWMEPEDIQVCLLENAKKQTMNVMVTMSMDDYKIYMTDKERIYLTAKDNNHG